MIILGIETSCDETAAAVVQDGNILLSNVVFSSMDLHTIYGGVVPEIAARSHIESIIPVIDQALQAAFPNANPQMPIPDFDPWSKIDAIAVTYGAGLGGCLLVGVMTARTLAIIKNKPLYAVNHVEGHVYANFLTEVVGMETQDWRLEKLHPQSSILNLPSVQPSFPILALIVSGSHTQLVFFKDHFDYRLLGQTRDDAIGEAFDKVARMIGLPYPGGPSISKLAPSGDSKAFTLPKAKLDSESEELRALRTKYEVRSTKLGQKTSYSSPRTSYDFSFSGLKTAVLRHAQEMCGKDFTFPSKDLPKALSKSQKADIAAVFQRVAIETVVDKTIQAFEEFSPSSIVIAGGVAANTELRHQLTERMSKVEGRKSKVESILHFTDQKLCTDNGAMIATLGCFKMKHNQPVADPYSLEIQPNLSM